MGIDYEDVDGLTPTERQKVLECRELQSHPWRNPQNASVVGNRIDQSWLTNLMMFSAEASLLLVFFAGRRKSNGLTIDTSDALTIETRPQSPPAYYFLVPASCDVLGTRCCTYPLSD